MTRIPVDLGPINRRQTGPLDPTGALALTIRRGTLEDLLGKSPLDAFILTWQGNGIKLRIFPYAASDVFDKLVYGFTLFAELPGVPEYIACDAVDWAYMLTWLSANCHAARVSDDWRWLPYTRKWTGENVARTIAAWEYDI